MRLTDKETIEVLKNHHKMDEEIYVTWLAKNEVEDLTESEFTVQEWQKFLIDFDDEPIEQMIDQAIQEGIAELQKGRSKNATNN